MLSRVRHRWSRLRETLWFVPGAMTLLALGLALFTVHLDRRLLESGHAGDMWFVFGVGAEGTRGVLSAIAGSIITVTGVVFSITIVALQLASTQFTPRVLRTFLEDRANHVVLGVFIGTFTYALLILRFVRAESEGAGAFVPSISVTVAMALALASIGCLIFFIDHSANSIRASTIIERLVADAVNTAHRAYPRAIGDPAETAAAPRADDVSVPASPPATVCAHGRGYLHSVDEGALLALPCGGRATLRVEGRVGDYVRTGDVLLSVWSDDPADLRDLDADALRGAFPLGSEPGGPHDVGLGISRLVDIAVKALSPGINDPTTAVMCLDGLGEVLVVLGGREPPPSVRAGEHGRVRLIAPSPAFDEMVELAFAQIRHYGASTPTIALKLIELAGVVAARVPVERRASLVRQARHVARAADETIQDTDDRARVHAVASRVLGAMTTGAEPAGATGRYAPGGAG